METIRDELLRSLLSEDVHYIDLTTFALGISERAGTAEILSREDGVVACSEEAARLFELHGCDVDLYLKSGDELAPGQPILRARGSAGRIHLVYRAAQTLLAYASGVATYTRRLVEEARSVNPRVQVATTRQAPPGARPFYFKAVLAGGGIVHRQSLSDSILIFDAHLAFVERPRIANAVARALSRGGGRGVGVEVRSLEEALEAVAAGAYYVQFERPSPGDLAARVREIRRLNGRAVIGVAGGITLENVREYASTGVDIVVTSAPYRARPLDITTKVLA